MGSHQTLIHKILMLPMAAALTEANAPHESWYSIKAAGRGVAEVLLYDEIGVWGITALQFARDLKAMGDLNKINLHIHSPGGDVFEGTAIYNLLRNHPASVDVYIDGLAASMASVIAMAGDTIYMPENAMMMVHKPWGIQGGDADDMRRYAELLDKVEDTLVMAYANKTGKSSDDIKALLKEETWMNGREAVAAGFADQLTEPLQAAAHLSSKRMQEFAHMPEALKTLLAPRAQTPAAPTNLARASLVDRGIGVASLNAPQMVGLAFTHTSSDFGLILLDVANKSVLAGWEEAEETFPLWTKPGILTDFKPARRVGLGEFSSLRQVREGAEYKYVTLGERGEQIILATYGELFSITRQAIINDDLQMLSDIPFKLGQAAKATIGDLVYAVLTGNPAMSDGKALFHADHSNLLTGAASALSIDSLSKAKTQMATQKAQVEKGKGRTLNIRPGFVLTPVALEDKANQIINSESVPGADVNSGIVNPIRAFAQVIGEPRLDDASATAWYMAAKKGSDTIEVAYLDGVDTPYLEQQEGFTVDGVASKVRIDAGVAPLDFRGLQKSNGA